MQRFQITSPDDSVALQKVGEIVTAGGVIACPTDTLYGFSCDPFCEPALQRIYSLKGREHVRPLLILLNDASRFEQWCEDIPPAARELTRHWPAPLTIVLRARSDLPPNLLRGGDTLGFRVPDSPVCRAVCAVSGGALTSTSVNRSGEPPLVNPDEIADRFGEALDGLVDAGEVAHTAPSTVVRCLESQVEILRPGAFKIPK